MSACHGTYLQSNSSRERSRPGKLCATFIPIAPAVTVSQPAFFRLLHRCRIPRRRPMLPASAMPSIAAHPPAHVPSFTGPLLPACPPPAPRSAPSKRPRSGLAARRRQTTRRAPCWLSRCNWRHPSRWGLGSAGSGIPGQAAAQPEEQGTTGPLCHPKPDDAPDLVPVLRTWPRCRRPRCSAPPASLICNITP